MAKEMRPAPVPTVKVYDPASESGFKVKEKSAVTAEDILYEIHLKQEEEAQKAAARKTLLTPDPNDEEEAEPEPEPTPKKRSRRTKKTETEE